MTNAEKYEEVFGFPPDTGNCPAEDCPICPCADLKHNNGHNYCVNSSTHDWWNEEYKGGAE